MALSSVLAGQLFPQQRSLAPHEMDHAKRLYLIYGFDREYKRLQRPSTAIAKSVQCRMA